VELDDRKGRSERWEVYDAHIDHVSIFKKVLLL
jgi:hypothetical protein